jgi:hypothetical protein
MLLLNPIRQSYSGGDVVQCKRDGTVERSVLAVLSVAHWRRRVLAKSHQAVAVRIIEDVRRCGSQ